MTELEKIKYAKSFIDKLANGINPLDDRQISPDDIVNNVRLSRCFFYVSDILRQVIENGGVQNKTTLKQRKKPFSLTEEQKSKLQISNSPLAVSEISAFLNSIINVETTKKISAAAINEWLLKFEFLEEITLPNGKHRKRPTPQGNTIGIYSEERIGQYGNYVIVMFSSQAQQFIYDNIDAIIDFKNQKETTSENQGQPWNATQDEILIDMFNKNLSVAEMAAALKRSHGGIKARLQKLGLIENRNDVK